MPTIWKERKLKFLAKVRTSNVDKHIVDSEIPVAFVTMRLTLKILTLEATP